MWLLFQGTTCGKLQEEIDAVKQKLKDIESRISPGKLESGVDNLESPFGMHGGEEDLLQFLEAEPPPMSPMKAGARKRSDLANETGKVNVDRHLTLCIRLSYPVELHC